VIEIPNGCLRGVVDSMEPLGSRVAAATQLSATALITWGFSQDKPWSMIAKEALGDVLRKLFTNVLYPMLLIGIWFGLLVLIIYIISEGNTTWSQVRRAVAALLPVVLLIAVLLPTSDQTLGRSSLHALPTVLGVIIGAILGLFGVEAGKRAAKSDSDTELSLYILFLSLIDMFIIYSSIVKEFDSLNSVLLSMILAAGLDIVFRGLHEEMFHSD
jgi:hypothetical protein